MTLRRSWLTIGLVAFWILPTIVAVIGFQIVPSARNPGISLGELIVAQVLVWFAWAGWSPVIIAASTRFPFARGRILPAVAVHVVLAIVVISLQHVYMAYVWQWFNLSPVRGLSSKLAIGWRSYGDLYVVVYIAIVGAHAAARWYEAWQEQRVVAAQLERDLTAAQLSALRSQLNPHFLFNSLHSVVTLIGRDPDGARRMVIRLADLLRATLGMAEEQLIPLSRELEMVRNYLDIELVRFADRLSVDWEVDDHLMDALVPAFALQPFVENAIIHGVSRISGPGHIRIIARANGDRLELRVVDNGPGPSHPATRRTGIGLANLRARLGTLYATTAAAVTLERVPEGTLATLTIPLQLAQAAA
jgi:anti-sigma regulatory factor (Ser/Thr protein kinase)